MFGRIDSTVSTPHYLAPGKCSALEAGIPGIGYLETVKKNGKKSGYLGFLKKILRTPSEGFEPPISRAVGTATNHPANTVSDSGYLDGI